MAVKPKQASKIPVPVSKMNKPAPRTPKRPFKKSTNSPAGPSAKKNITPRKRAHSGTEKTNEEDVGKRKQQNADGQSERIKNESLTAKPKLIPSTVTTTNSRRVSVQVSRESASEILDTPEQTDRSKVERTDSEPATDSQLKGGKTKDSSASSGSNKNPAGQKISKRHKRNQKAILKRQLLDDNSCSKTVKTPKTDDRERNPTESTNVAETPEDTSQVPSATDAEKDEDHTAAGKKTGRDKGEVKGKSRKFDKDDKKFGKSRDTPKGTRQDRGRARTGFTPQQQQEIDDYRKSLESQGAPKEVIAAAMFKKVRSIQRRNKRTAEKRCNKVCLSCRKLGHVLKDCPEASSETGSCFKCGSKEHTSRECPNKSENYAFATCYICKEKGHIAKHCKQNPHGLYVRGGSCHYCGDIRHFARDCPNKNRTEGDAEDVEEPRILAGTLKDNQTSADADLNEEPPRKVAKTERKRGGVVKF